MPRKAKEKKLRGVFEREKGSGIFWVRFVDLDGKRKSRCIGNFSDAVNFYEAERVRIWKRILAPIASHKGIRYGQLVDEALRFSEASHPAQRGFAQRLERTRAQFGHRMADSITPAEIAEWFSNMLVRRKWTPATVNRYRAAMSKAFKIGIQNGRVTVNPARLVP